MQSLRFWGACLALWIASPVLAEADTFAEGLRSCPRPSATPAEYRAVWHGIPLTLNDVTRGMAFRGLLGLARTDAFGTPEIYVTFDTRSVGVSLPDFVRSDHPKDITIVLQYQFADLIVGPDSFDVTVWFGGRLANLHLPFSVLTLFLDDRMSFCYAATPGGSGPPSAPQP